MKVKLWLGTPLLLLMSGCALWHEGGRSHGASTPLVDFLYGYRAVPAADAVTELQLPMRVGVSFLPSSHDHGNAHPSAMDREKILTAVRAHFGSLKYVSEIVIVPDYYLSAKRGNGFGQIEQLSRLHKLDLFALVSYDQIVDATTNKRSLAYLTIVGSFLVRGDRHETHTLLDFAVIDPRSRSLVMRAGGTSSLAGNTTAVDARSHEIAQRERGFELAGTAMIANLQRELTAFEMRVREGTAPVRVTRRSSGGGGALDPVMLALLVGCLGMTVLASRRHFHGRRRFGRVFRRMR